MALNASRSDEQPLDVLLLAADRTVDDPVRLAAGTACKALVKVAGRPMILRVLDALCSIASIQTFILCGPPQRMLEQLPELQRFLRRDNVRYVAAQASLGASVAAGIKAAPAHAPLLLTTADNALLDTEILARFLHQCRTSRADLCIGMVDYAAIRRAYPQAQRTALIFSDAQYCGCNLYFINTAAGRGLVQHWQSVQHNRKTPWLMMARLLGLPALLRYAFGVLSAPAACRAVAEKTGLRVAIVDVPFARAGIDVDTIADLELAERILEGKR